MTSYETVYNMALRMINDPTLAVWPEEDLKRELHAWMLQAVYKLPKLREELSERDEEMECFVNDLSDKALTVLAIGMRREWLAPQITSVSLTLQRSSKKESYNQKDFLASLMSLDDSLNVQMKKILRDETYIDNPYLQ